jgi:hypothetical protein
MGTDDGDKPDTTALDFREIVRMAQAHGMEGLDRDRAQLYAALATREKETIERGMFVQDLGVLFDRVLTERNVLQAKLNECLATKEDIAEMSTAAMGALKAMAETDALRSEIATVRAQNDLLTRVNIVLADDGATADVMAWLADTLPIRTHIETLAEQAMRRILRFDEVLMKLHVGPLPVAIVSHYDVDRVRRFVANEVLAAIVAALPEVPPAPPSEQTET